MEKLMKPAEYAKELGISRQAVYAKIKRGVLISKNIDGKLYIVVDKMSHETTDNTLESTIPENNTILEVKDTKIEYQSLLEAKDETISILKDTVKELKKSNKQISKTLKSEIALLKDAFHEMRSLYILQLEQKNRSFEDIIEVEEDIVEINWIGLKRFFKVHKISKQNHQDKILKRLKKAIKRDDKRMKIVDNKIKLNANADYKDIIK